LAEETEDLRQVNQIKGVLLLFGIDAITEGL
jgi:hypothetical protein